MRISIFWRIFAILCLPILQILAISGLIKIPILLPFIENNLILFVIIGCLTSLFMAYVTSKRYSGSIEKLISILKNPAELALVTKPRQRMPPDFERLFLAIKEEISSSLEIKASLEADRKLFNSILGNMNDGILLADQNGFITMANQSAYQIFQIAEQDAINHSLVEVMRDYRINDLFLKCAKSKKPEMVSFEISPEKTFVHCIATPLDPEIPGSILFLFQDLTRLHQLEIIRRDFVSNVSHELRTPITSLKLITETLQEGAIDSPATARNFIEKMDSEVDKLSQLVEELLELSKIESGKVPLEKKNINPKVFIDLASERMALQAKRAGLILKNTVKQNLPDTFVDPIRLEQVLVNLIHNAIKFTPPGGQIEVSANQESESIVYFVKDNGKGIPPKDLERIFERFYKIDQSRSERGTGLGLSISRHLVEAHNGKIWVDSQPGLGSTFFFRIPIR